MDQAVPFVDLRAQHAPLLDGLRMAFDRVVDRNAFILGEEVERFEEEFAAYCQARHCIGVASGTVALAIAMRGAGIGPGDEVIVPAHTYIASALGVLHAGADPVFCDVEEGTGLIDLSSAEAVVSARTAGVLPVHLYGQVCDMDAVTAFAERHGLAAFEDAAQAHGATYRGIRAGSFGTAAAFSFYPSKNLGALGDGGAICTDDDEVANRARVLRHLGQRGKGEHVVAGYNERLDGLQAAFLRAKLPHLDRWNQSRRERAATYRRKLPGEIRLLEERPDSPCVYHLFPVRVANRDALGRQLSEHGIGTGVHYTPAVHHQPPFRRQGEDASPELPVATRWAGEELSLPIFDAMTDEQVELVASACERSVASSLR